MKNKILKNIQIIVIFLTILLLVFIFGLEMANLNKVIYGVSIGSEKIGGLNQVELKKTLFSKLKKLENINIKNNNETWVENQKNLGVVIDMDKSLNSAFLIGREQNIFLGLKTQLVSLFTNKEFKLQVDIDNTTLDEFVSKKLSKLNVKAQNAKFLFNEDNASIIKESFGKLIDKETLKKDILNKISSLSDKDIKIKFKTDFPNITEKDLKLILNDVSKLLVNAPYLVFEDGSQSWKIDKSQIKDFIMVEKKDTAKLRLNQKKIKDFLIQISPSINRSPKNATLTIKNNKVSEFAISQNGLKLEIEKSAKEIENKILNGEKKIQLITKEVLAEIRTETIDNLGIIEKIGSGISDFSGSPASRIHNIKLGAAKINGTLLKPGEEFSFVKNIGEISKGAGYKPSYVIKNGKTYPEYGGGLCQVSTTTFRAAMYAGLKITERFPHSYPVKYYNPQGFDAAIYGPHPDLRFKNDTPANILIQAYTKGTKLYFDFYGTSDGRETKLIGPIVYDKKPDGSLKTKLTREIYDKDGELITKRTFWSSYKSKDLYPIVKNPLE